MAPEIKSSIFELVLSSIPCQHLLSPELHSSQTQKFASKLVRNDVDLSLFDQISKFVEEAAAFESIVCCHAKHKTCHINYVYCASLSLTLPLLSNPLLSKVTECLTLHLDLDELALVCYEPIFAQFILRIKMISLKKLFIQYNIDEEVSTLVS